MDKISQYLNRHYLKVRPDTPSDVKKVRCHLCQDQGIIIKGDLAYQCHCVKQRSVMKRFASANMTPFLAHHTFDQFDLAFYSPHLRLDKDGPTYRAMAEKAVEGAKKFVAQYLEEKTGQGILLNGAVGSGKTFLAGAIANALLEHDKQVLFLVVPDFLDDIRGTYQKQGEFSEADLMNAARNTEVLILDDLGAHNYSEWTQNKIFSLINYRMNHGLPCVITTNLTIEEMNEVIGERTVSRIIEICKIYRMHVEVDIRVAMRKW
ncbi:ATP-binding protein [Dehalobacterium formicoaceticum]|uniref:ATP-binding protein n=1 Tax=Dehalobacterium formicoaceticum TaxID=51515 RepID=A0ABT1Y8W0_9FIRM|nr:ATP-binding protein [Dehalobacterium formicoaceticum]MCR6546339.1 ATP-binding protein [Dehalobacterium formicoaceticum]